MGYCVYCSRQTRPGGRSCGNVDDSVCCSCAHGATGNYGHGFSARADAFPSRLAASITRHGGVAGSRSSGLPSSFACSTCRRSFRTSGALAQHAFAKHGLALGAGHFGALPPAPSNAAKAQSADNGATMPRFSPSAPTRTTAHHANSRHHCPICFTSLDSRELLTDHLQSAHPSYTPPPAYKPLGASSIMLHRNLWSLGILLFLGVLLLYWFLPLGLLFLARLAYVMHSNPGVLHSYHCGKCGHHLASPRESTCPSCLARLTSHLIGV